MSANNHFAEVFEFPPTQGTQHSDAYEKFVASCVPHCRCATQFVPCDGVLAGGLCDNQQDERDDFDEDDLSE